MRKLLSLAGVAAMLLGGCTTYRNLGYQELPSEPVNQEGLVHSQFFVGKVDGVSFSGASIIRVFPAGDKMGICGVYRLTSPVDIRSKFREGLKAEASTLQIKDGVRGGTVLRVSPAFMKLAWKQAPVSTTREEADVAMGVGATEPIPAGCVRTEAPWEPAKELYLGDLDLFLPVGRR